MLVLSTAMSGAHTGDSLQQLDWLTHCELFPTLQQGYILKACELLQENDEGGENDAL